MNKPILYGLLMFAVAGTALQWFWVWHFIKRVSEIEEKFLRELAILSNTFRADTRQSCKARLPRYHPKSIIWPFSPQQSFPLAVLKTFLQRVE